MGLSCILCHPIRQLCWDPLVATLPAQARGSCCHQQDNPAPDTYCRSTSAGFAGCGGRRDRSGSGDASDRTVGLRPRRRCRGGSPGLLCRFGGRFLSRLRRLGGRFLGRLRRLGGRFLGRLRRLSGRFLGRLCRLGGRLLGRLCRLSGRFLGRLCRLGGRFLGWLRRLGGRFLGWLRRLGGRFLGWLRRLGGRFLCIGAVHTSHHDTHRS